MKLKELLAEYVCSAEDVDVSDLQHSAENVRHGSLFFCLVGSKCDGHDFAAIAERNGAVAVVCEREVDVRCPQVLVPDTRVAFARAASAFFGNPAARLKMFGITGTNGKTTTSYVLAEILKAAGEEVGLIGTNCIRYGEHCLPAALTTPDPVELHRALAEMSACGVTSVVMEVSAHALALDKTSGIRFEAAGFTNLSRDHLDYFGTMEAYARAKEKLFTVGACKNAAVNVDDAMGQALWENAQVHTLGYGAENPADVFGIDLRMSAEGLRYIINLNDDIGEVKFALPGKFNMYNTLCAATMAKLAGVRFSDILAGIRNLRRVDGRYNVINAENFSVIVDFAHTDDGLGNIITSVREFAPSRIITVFGCGGNRDKSKRRAMGRVAAQLSDITVITSDNPRDEDPGDIIADVYAGVPKDRQAATFIYPERTEAIAFACSTAAKGDIVIVAGKGAERYQEIKGIKYEYNDEEYIMRLLQGGKRHD